MCVNKTAIVEQLAEREISRCKPEMILKMLKRMKQARLNQKSLTIQLKNLSYSYDQPLHFLSFDQVYQTILKLDEAKDTMQQSYFKAFDAGIQTLTADYLGVCLKDLQKPFCEVYDLDLRFLFVNAILNADLNPSLFKVNIEDKIFERYGVTRSFNKLISKQYYDAELKAKKLVVSY